MARRAKTLRNSRLTVGAALVGFGMLILWQHLDRAGASLSRVMEVKTFHSLGLIAISILLASEFLKAYAMSHHSLVQVIFHQLAVSCWPLCLIRAGAFLAREQPWNNQTCRNKSGGNVDRGAADSR